jgi:hypothetical protein
MVMSTARRCLLCKRGDGPFELAAHRGESATGEKNYVAWLCESCGPRYREFTMAVLREFGVNNGLRITAPKQRWYDPY